MNKPLKKRAMDKIPQIFGVQKPEDLFALVGEGRMQPELGDRKNVSRFGQEQETCQANR